MARPGPLLRAPSNPLGSDRRRHRTTARPRHSSRTPQTPPRLPSLVDTRSRLHPIPRVARQLAHQHRERLLRRVPVLAVDVGGSRSAASSLDAQAGSCVASAADVRGVADVDRGRQELERVGDRGSVRSPLKARGGEPQAIRCHDRTVSSSTLAGCETTSRPDTCSFDWPVLGFWVGYFCLCGLFWFVMVRIAEWAAS
jgi:hypothetical protein